jgi:D-alanine transaminase
MPELAYVNGQFCTIEQAMVPLEDRGYQFGDAVYEFIVSYNSCLFCLEEHLIRLHRSMKELSFPPISLERIRNAICDLFDRAGLARAAIYLQISRGVTPRKHEFGNTQDCQFVMTIRRIEEKPNALREKGASAITLEDFRWGRCDIKTVQLLPNVLAKQKALDVGAFDAIFVTRDGVVREATSSNVFTVLDGRLITHPLTPNILSGITRLVIMDICKNLSIPVEERFYSTDDMYLANEVFLTGTTTEVFPIVNVDKNRIGDGRVGPVSKKLYRELLKRTEG